MNLLKNPADAGYPGEYLLSRIKGRRSRLVRDWRPLLFGSTPHELQPSPASVKTQKYDASDAAWRNLVREYQWVYAQMNHRFRGLCWPYFLYAELRTICICLRHLANKKTGVINELLDRSLLSDEVKEVLSSGTDLSAAVNKIERLFSELSGHFAGLGETLGSGGLRGFEQRLVETFLSVMISSRLHPLMNMFFSRIIDARNILTLYKYLRFDLKGRPLFIPGGSIKDKRVREIVAKDDLMALYALVREVTGSAVERPDPSAIELALYRGITRWLRKEGYDAFGVAPILDYLWRCSIEAMNKSVLYHTRDLERDFSSSELVR